MSKAIFSTRFLVLSVVFAVCLVASNFFEPRLWQVGNLNLQLTGGVLLFPITYILNDALTEVYGYRKARLVIWTAFGLNAFVALMSFGVSQLPAPYEESAKPLAEGFNTLFAFVPRITLASLLAFFCGSTVNSFVMSKMKVRDNGRRFGVRAVVSSLVGELTDSIVFFPIAFGGLMSFEAVVDMALIQIVVKVAYEIVILPVTNVFVKQLKKAEGIDTLDLNISYNPFKVKDL